MANVKYTISFLPNDRELLEFVEKRKRCQNFSAYVRELIRTDMEIGDNPELEKIYEYVAKRIKEEGYIVDGINNKTVTDFVDEADKEIILDLF